MELNIAIRRSLLIFLITALIVGAAVYSFHSGFHLGMAELGLSPRWADTLGAVAIVAVTYLGQHFAAMVFYRNMRFDLPVAGQDESEAPGDREPGRETAHELG